MEAAFFDLDKTIVARSSPLALGPSFFRSGLIGGTLLLKSLYAQLVFHLWGAGEEKMERMREEATRMTAGWEQERVRQVVSEVLDEVISPLIYAEALELMFDHRAAGRLICIVSSAPEEIVQPMAQMLQVDHFISTRAQVADGKYTGELDFYCYGPAKAEAMEALAKERDIDLSGSYAYTDSTTDRPMLEAVGHPVVVNPDKELRALATQRSWEVMWFRNPVSLRDRLPQIRVPELRVPEWKLPELRRPEALPPDVVARLVALGLVVGGALWLARRRSHRSLLARLL
jgi:HAD superfamily hydrolase (TIGR01490 family)